MEWLFSKNEEFSVPTFSRLEQCLLPPPETIRWDGITFTKKEYNALEKTAYCVKKFFTFVVLLLLSPVTLGYDWLTFKEVTPPVRTPSKTEWEPDEWGFATSFFQSSGLGTRWSATKELEGECDWNEWMAEKGNVIAPETEEPGGKIPETGPDYGKFFTDILRKPDQYIQMLVDHNVKAHRFSLEWSVIEKKPGEFNENAISLYKNFIRKLQEAGIKPSVTLSHFVIPKWFHGKGNFYEGKNIDLYVNFALKAMELFPEVTDWWSFNELGVKAFQQTREVYPTDLPIGAPLYQRVHAAGKSTEHMLIAHCKLVKQAKKRFPENKIGVTHQWLTFDTATGNPLERLIAHVLTKFAFTPVYEFFKTGHFAFQVPFMANIHFEVAEKEFINPENSKFLPRLGVQAYPKPMLKMGWNYGETYPGRKDAVTNFPGFTFGSTCEPGGIVSWFGPRQKTDAIDEMLDQAFELTDQVYLTEFGGDAMVHKWGEPDFKADDESQAAYLKALTGRIQEYCKKNSRHIKGMFCWTDLRQQMEWENGLKCKLGMIHPELDENRQMIKWNPTAASEHMQQLYGTFKALSEKAAANVA